MKRDYSKLKTALKMIGESYWDTTEQPWTSDKVCPNCKAQVQLKQENVGTDGKSKIQCASCGFEGWGKFVNGEQWIAWKMNPGDAYSKPYIGK